MSEQYRPNIGELCGADARRDAVHIAVAPLFAQEWLDPGQHVGLGREQHAYGVSADDQTSVGIVDPFLAGPVEPDGRFWCFLYPNTITNLRHVWEHPAFRARPPIPADLRREE